jgi:protein-S-isoprenylcysteine O-methyltransferase Ste14/uncharacterized membrane protein (UPF0127 family)
MPVYNKTKNSRLSPRASAAGGALTRLTGLLGTSRPDPGTALYLSPCTGVHTFGMRYPIDVIFLDGGGRVLKILQNMVPNRISGIVPGARSVLEVPYGALANGQVQAGDELQVVVDENRALDWHGIKAILHWPLNFCIAVLWALLLYSSYLKWHRTGQMLGLGLVLVNSVLCVLFLTRRESRNTSPHVLDWIVPFLTVALSLILRPHDAVDGPLSVLSGSLQIAGIAALCISLLSLGRSFGVVPANRGIKMHGLYRVVRHPVYASELVFYLGFLLGNMSNVNLSFVFLIVLGQIYRAFSEERLLKEEASYGEYLRKVRYRLVPGVF